MACIYTVKVENGYAKLFKSGDFELHICGNAISAEVKGSEIHVVMRDDTVKVYSVKGFYKRTIQN